MSLQVGIPIIKFRNNYPTYTKEIEEEIYQNVKILNEFNADPNQISYQIKYIFKTTNIIPDVYLTTKNIETHAERDSKQYWQAKYEDLHEKIFKQHTLIINTLS